MQQTGWALLVKKGMDKALAGSALLVTAPLQAGLACAIAVRMGTPVFFRQKRPGYHGKTIEVFKFRTMTNERDASGHLLPDQQRMTALGRWLRATSLDELPQMWNVLLGDLSLVGPRPLLMQYLPLYSKEQAKRHDVLPGITGWSQINGRNSIDWDQKLALDVWYVENWSLLLDLRIMVETAWKVLKKQDVAHPGHETMPFFTGSPEPKLEG
jgi:lipopolysaccharide/colanic/teichoic acid biosynthesis glycosyltransferase